MEYGTIFYIISAILIVASVLCIFSNKLIISAFSVFVFMLSTAVLFFCINSFLCGIFQMILTLLSIILSVIIYKNLPKKNNKDNILKTKRFWAGIITVSALMIFAGLFTYYYMILNSEDNILIFSEKAVISPSLSALITAKSVFADYFLSYFYIVLIFAISVCAVWLLVRGKSEGEKND